MNTGKKKFTAAVIALAAVVFIPGAVLLPDTVTVQIDSYGNAQSTMPKAAGLLIPLVITLAGTVIYIKTDSKKAVTVSATGLIAGILTLVFNV